MYFPRYIHLTFRSSELGISAIFSTQINTFASGSNYILSYLAGFDLQWHISLISSVIVYSALLAPNIHFGKFKDNIFEQVATFPI